LRSEYGIYQIYCFGDCPDSSFVEYDRKKRLLSIPDSITNLNRLKILYLDHNEIKDLDIKIFSKKVLNNLVNNYIYIKSINKNA